MHFQDYDKNKTIHTTPSESPATFQQAVKLLEAIPPKAWLLQDVGSTENPCFTLSDARKATCEISPLFLVEVDLLTGAHVSRDLEHFTYADGVRTMHSFSGPEVDALFEKVRDIMLDRRKNEGTIYETLKVRGFGVVPDGQREGE